MARSDARASGFLVFRLFGLTGCLRLWVPIDWGQSMGNKGPLTGLLVALRLDRG